MKVPVDALGNVLREGDLIQIELPSPRLVCRIHTIKEGGISLSLDNNRKVRPGLMESHATVFTQFDPNNPVVPNALKLHQPKSKDQDASGIEIIN